MLTFIFPLHGKHEYRSSVGLAFQVNTMAWDKDDGWQVIGMHKEIWEPLLEDWRKTQKIQDATEREVAVGEWFNKYTPPLGAAGYKVFGLTELAHISQKHAIDTMANMCQFDCSHCHDGSCGDSSEDDDTYEDDEDDD